MSPLTGLLYSQIGYDLGDPMRAIVRATQADFISAAALFTLRDTQSHQFVLTGPVTRWGEKWGSTWWVADFSAIQQPGEFVLQILARKVPQIIRDYAVKLNQNELFLL